MDIAQVSDLESIDQMFEAATDRQQPVLLFFSQQDCHYCEALQQTVLLPLLAKQQKSGYDILVQEAHFQTDINKTDAALQALKDIYAVDFFPTLLFLGRDRQELTRHIGYQPENDLASYYIDKAIAEAIRKYKAS